VVVAKRSSDSIHCAECDVDIATKRLVEAARADVLPTYPEAIAKQRQHDVSTRRRGPLGIPRINRHGSPNRCFRRTFSQPLRKPRLRLSQSDWGIALVRSRIREATAASTALDALRNSLASQVQERK